MVGGRWWIVGGGSWAVIGRRTLTRSQANPHSSHAGAETDAAGAGILRSAGHGQVPAAHPRAKAAVCRRSARARRTAQRWARRAAPPCRRSPPCRSSSAGRLPRAAERHSARVGARNLYVASLNPRAVAYVEKGLNQGRKGLQRPHYVHAGAGWAELHLVLTASDIGRHSTDELELTLCDCRRSGRDNRQTSC